MWRVVLIAVATIVFATMGGLVQSDEQSKVKISFTDQLVQIGEGGKLMYLRSGLVLRVLDGGDELVEGWPRPSTVRLLPRDVPKNSRKEFEVTLGGTNQTVNTWIESGEDPTQTHKPSKPWFYWRVCAEPKAIGVSAEGDKVHCYKCSGPSITFSEDPGVYCFTFNSRQEAKDFMTSYCDCP